MLIKRFYETTSDGLTLSVKVQPGAASDGFAGILDGRLKVRVRAKAVEGAANERLCKFIAASLAVSKSSVSLLKGEKSREKLILIKGASDQLAEHLEKLVNEDRGI